MKKIYELLATRLKEIEEIRFIDMDNGQIDYYEYRAAVDFPACLISFDIPDCNNIGLSNQQQCRVNINIRLVDLVFDNSNIDAPDDVRNRALFVYDILNNIQEKLQGWKPHPFVSNLTRINISREKRNDGLMVLSINYSATIIDNLHFQTQYIEISPNPTIEISTNHQPPTPNN